MAVSERKTQKEVGEGKYCRNIVLEKFMRIRIRVRLSANESWRAVGENGGMRGLRCVAVQCAK